MRTPENLYTTPIGTVLDGHTPVLEEDGTRTWQPVDNRTVTIADVAGLQDALNESTDIANTSGTLPAARVTGLPTADTPNQVAAKIAVADDAAVIAAARGNLGLGTAAPKDTGTAIGNVVELVDVGGNPGLPAIDASLLDFSNLPKSAPPSGGLWIDGDAVRISGASLPGGAIGIWYVDEYEATPTPVIPNSQSDVAISPTLLSPPRRFFNNNSFWNKAAATATDGAGASSDSIAGDASRLLVSSADGFLWKARTLTAGTYTICVTAKSNTGLDQDFRMQFFNSNQTSTPKTATSAWQRFTFTATVLGGSELCIPIRTLTSSGSLDLLIHDAELFEGSADLHEDLAGHISLGIAGSGEPTFASGVLDFNSAYGFLQFQGDRNLTEYTAIVIASKTAAGSAFQGFLSNAESFANFTTAFEVSGTAATGKAASYLPGKGDGLWSLLGKGFQAITQRYDGTSFSTWINDVLLYQKENSLSSVNVNDLWVGAVNSTSFLSGYEIAAIAFWDRSLTDDEVRAATSLLETRVGLSSVTLTPPTRYLVAEGDSITNGLLGDPYPNLFGPNSSPAIVGNNYAVGSATLSGNSGNSSTDRAPLADAVIPEDKNGREFIYTILIGRNDGPRWGTAANYAQAVADLLAARKVAGFDKTVICTLLPTTETAYPGYNAWRNSVNAIWRDSTFRASNGIDAVCDFAADSTIGTDAAASNTTYYPDGVHPNDAGYAIMETIYRAAINSL